MKIPVQDIPIGTLDIRDVGGGRKMMLYRYSKTEFLNAGWWHDLSDNGTPLDCLYFIPVELV